MNSLLSFEINFWIKNIAIKCVFLLFVTLLDFQYWKFGFKNQYTHVLGVYFLVAYYCFWNLGVFLFYFLFFILFIFLIRIPTIEFIFKHLYLYFLFEIVGIMMPTFVLGCSLKLFYLYLSDHVIYCHLAIYFHSSPFHVTTIHIKNQAWSPSLPSFPPLHHVFYISKIQDGHQKKICARCRGGQQQGGI